MRNLRFSLRSAVLAGMGLAFLVPAFAQQEGPMQPVERQTARAARRSGAAGHDSSSAGCCWDGFES